MRKLIGLWVVVFFALCGFVSAEQVAGSFEVEFSFPPVSVTTGKVGEYDLISIGDCECWNQAGEPQLPVKSVSVVLPPGAQLHKVELVKATREELQGRYRIVPVQEAIPLSEIREEKLEFTQPQAAIYQAEGFFPDSIFEVQGRSNVEGQEVVNLLLFPLQYSPLEGKVVLYSFIRVSVSYQAESMEKSAEAERTTQGSPGQRLLQKRVANPELIELGVTKASQLKRRELESAALPPGNYEYLIITSASYESAFAPLANWKTKKGVPAEIVTTSWIQSNYTGRDLAEQIRNFIKDAVASWGTDYVLLGGDTGVIPDRITFAMDSGTGADRDDIRCDLYYSDLDGSFDADGDSVFGEVVDDVDLYPDVFVGRAGVNTLTKVQTFVNKVLTYEKNPAADYLLKVLFFAEIEQSYPYSDSSVSADYIDEHLIPERFKPATKLYQRLGNENPSTVIAALNQGPHFVNHLGHAWYNNMRVGGSGNYIYRSDMDGLTNGTKYGILYSTGCWPAAIDQDCMAEHFVNNPNGGGIAFVGNSRYGWFSPGNPLFGHSDRFHHWFYRTIFFDDIFRLGEVVAADKMHFIPWSREENIYRWHQYEINLLGDPELPVWTDNPDTLEVHHPQDIPGDEMVFPVTVLCNSEPLPDALVCVMKGTEVYDYGHTDVTGTVSFTIQPVSTGQVEVTVTARNCLPYEGTVPVNAAAKYMGISDIQIDDDATGQSSGNGDGKVNPGEVIEWGICLKNYTSLTLNNVSATLELLQPATGNLGEEDYGDLAAGAEAQQTFLVPVSGNAHNGEVYLCRLTISDEDANEWIYYPGMAVAEAQLCLDIVVIDDTVGGDGDGIPEAGETFQLSLTLHNEGLGSVNNVSARILSHDAYVEVGVGTVVYGDFASGEKRPGAGSFALSISALCQGAHCVTLPVLISGDGYSCTKGLLLGIGDVGFNDDMESGSGLWTLEGSGNLWHLSSHRPRSDSWSWYCGNEGTFQYNNYMNGSIISPEITLPPNAMLSFWRWYEVAMYGTNGLYVELWVDGEWEQLDFIGSGGALGDLAAAELLSGWFQETYDLSHYPPGTVVRVRFRFASDGEPVEEGFYLDDIMVKSKDTPYEGEIQTSTKLSWHLYR